MNNKKKKATTIFKEIKRKTIEEKPCSAERFPLWDKIKIEVEKDEQEGKIINEKKYIEDYVEAITSVCNFYLIFSL